MPHQSQQSRRPVARIALASGLASAAIAATLVPTGGTPASAATVGVLCTGFGTCTDAGMGGKGYHAVWNTMFWGMYAGKNCTNYVAFRMIKAGMSSARPTQLKPGKGDARYWGSSFGSLTNKTPTVGSVAWWNANVPGAGSGGHVAIVEKVYSATDIVVSESNWSGNFDWRRITTAANWPSGFIHLRDSGATTPPTTPTPTPTPKPTPTPTTPATGAPVNTSRPTISGIVAVGQRLAATPGTWNQSGLTFSYQWYVDGVANPKETGSTIDLAKGRYQKTIAVQVKATGKAGSTTAMSATTARVLPGTIGVTAKPQITGTPAIGKVVTAVAPKTTKELTSTSVQWYADGQAVPGATGWSLTLGAAQVAHRLTVQVHGAREAFNDVIVSSDPSDPVQAPPLQVASAARVVGQPNVRATLSADPGVTKPAATRVTYTWLRDGQPIPGATAATYTPTTSDLMHHLGVRVTRTVPGYYPLTTEHVVAAPVTALPKLKVKASAGRRAATAVVKVKALGQLVKGGSVTVRVGKHKVTAKVHGKRLVLHLHGLRGGKRVLKIAYAGTDRYASAATAAKLRIRR